MNFATNAASWGLSNILPLFNGGSLVMYTGTQPTTPETALSGNTALATFVFNTTAFAQPVFSTPNDAASASFVASSVTPGASGTVTFARASVKQVNWAANATYAQLFTIAQNSGALYVLTKTGTAAASVGPTAVGTAGTNLSITDGGCQWAYYSATTGQNNILADFSCGTSATDIVIGSAAVTTTVQITMTSFVLQTTAS